MNNAKKRDEFEKKQKRLKIIGAILLIITIVIIIILLLKKCGMCYNDGQESVRLNYDVNSELGQLETKTMEEIQEELNRVIDESKFNVSINATPTFASGNAEGDLCIENVPGNHFLMSVKITLDDTGETIYQSGLIKPNYHIQNVKLDKPLSKGVYSAKALFTAHDMETGEPQGNVGVKMVIYVES